jgi:hypothetical protein
MQLHDTTFATKLSEMREFISITNNARMPKGEYE